MNESQIAKLTDAEVLSLAGGFGPAIIGQALFERAQEIRQRTDNGRFGPALVDPDYGLDISPWDEYSRRDLLAIAREHELPVKSNASRDEIARALSRKKILPAAEEETDGGAGGGDGNSLPPGDDEGEV